MVELQYRKPNEIKQDYAPRIDQQQWQCHEGTVRHLHEQGKTRKEIIEHLLEAHAFHPTLAQLNAQMRRWGLKVYRKFEPDPSQEWQDGDTMSLCELPENDIVDTSCVSSNPDSSVHDIMELQPGSIDDCSQDIDQTDSDLVENRSLKENTIATNTCEQSDLQLGHPVPPLNEKLQREMPRISMGTLSSEPAPSMSVCGRSSISHGTRSTFARHVSDTSSFKDFRSTAARVHKASKLASQPTGTSSEYTRCHTDSIISLLNSWVFTIGDVDMFRELYENLLKVGSILGRFGCICKRTPSIPPAPLYGKNEDFLAALLLHLSRLQARNWFPRAPETGSSRIQAYITNPSLLGAFAPHPLVTKFDTSFAKEGCLDCLMTRLDTFAKTASYNPLHQTGSHNDLLVDSHSSRLVWTELARCLRKFCINVRARPSGGPEFEAIAATQLKDMYESIQNTRVCLPGFHHLCQYSEFQAEA